MIQQEKCIVVDLDGTFYSIKNIFKLYVYLSHPYIYYPKINSTDVGSLFLRNHLHHLFIACRIDFNIIGVNELCC